MLKKTLHILLFMATVMMYSQDEENKLIHEIKTDSTNIQYYIIEGDTILHESIGLDEVIVFGRLKFNNNLARRKYLILRRKTRKVFPYAKLAAERLMALNERLEGITSKKKKKKYIKILQKYMEEEFTSELKKLTRTEGQILVKLIYRQTGKTMFELVKEYRSGWRAFWYNNTARLFSISLKEKYDPVNVEEDYWIEDILQRSFQSGILQEQKTVLEFNYYDLKDKWSGKVKAKYQKK